MGREEEIVNERLKKIEEMRKLGINPYAYKFDKKDFCADLQKEYKKLENEKFGKKAVSAGRIMSIRDLGKLIFAVLRDSTGTIQVVLQDKKTSEKQMELFKKFVDSGDFIGVSGKVFRTKRGELSILAENIEILTKSLKPMPEKFHGLQDKEERYRKRYLDLLMNPEIREVFEKREKIIDAIREFLKSKGFNEVETPYLQTIYGGASAKPFKTYLNALDIELFLAISPELYLKRLIVGGYEKVFTIARNFRNEGIDRWHNPEFTMMEIYQAYADYNDMMELFEDVYEYVAKKVNGSTKMEFRGKIVDFKKPWKRMTMKDAIKKFAEIDVDKMSEKELCSFIKKNNIECKGEGKGWATQAIFEHFCEDKIEQPTFIIDHPLETTPLCKLHRNDKSCELIERFEPFCMGAELGNAYSELNDPVLQKKLLEEQQKTLKKGNEEANPYDEDFINAIEVGMPPTGGIGLGVDRMIMFLTGQDSIRDIILFPFMKPEVEEKEKQNEPDKQKQNKRNN
ncbi:MAG: lysine--tRNA ligase [Nanoarchaeota archaeon]|nr:lysine--tRNA ligase [Nanoarchaeota archaeon]